ncbi:uncharacterized protein LOC125948075 isoform X1 [Anopheles darlingi]|uniref:uncharacterized protein LOC125948075 isoform X1 n=1 Tax=Anopheles darlingi TaxID=43151 RepID=UPI00210052A8|nr:uncharacterized protein LOC125948075 isoform X1 [Anopheles darlingi]XP_049529723.1 uncharacterized protein LOC125948075 isoform X1 [Anopheles darlingi]
MVIILIVLPAACHHYQPKPKNAPRGQPSRRATSHPQPQPAPQPASSAPCEACTRSTRRCWSAQFNHQQQQPWVDANNNEQQLPKQKPSAPAPEAHGLSTAGLSYLTRIIISDDYSQIADAGAQGRNTDDNGASGGDGAGAVEPEVETINREEEIVKKRKTELTTTRQTETRIKRQLLFEDGKVVEDSGPIVSTNTHEDTDRQETVQTEHRTLGDPAAASDGREAAAIKQEPKSEPKRGAKVPKVAVVAMPSGSTHPHIAPKTISVSVKEEAEKETEREEGLLRNVQEEVSVSREQTTERTEVAEQKHFGDFTDEAYLRAISSGVGDVRELLLSDRCRSELSPTGPQIVQHSINSRKVTDSEETNIRQLAKQDGTLVTEKQQTRQHEELYDDEIPPDAPVQSPGYDQVDSSGERLIEQKSAAQRYYKLRDEQHVDVVANGRVIGHEMRYAAEQTQLERDGGQTGDPGMLSDWDSLSDRLRKARRLGRPPKGGGELIATAATAAGLPPGQHQQHQHLLLPTVAAAAGPNDRLDALTKKPLDFDKEEETRKHETNKWLESHFGSESRSSRDSREDLDDDDEEEDRDEQLVEPTKKTYFNVTIKSNGGGGGGSVPEAMVDVPLDPRRHLYGSSGQLHRPQVALSMAKRGDQAPPPSSYRQPRPIKEALSGSREDLLFGGGGGAATTASGTAANQRHNSTKIEREEYATAAYHNQQQQQQQKQQQQQQYRTVLPEVSHRERTTFNTRYGHPLAGPMVVSEQHNEGGRPQVPQRRKALERRFVATTTDQSFPSHPQQQTPTQQQQQLQQQHHQSSASLSNGQVQYHSSRNLCGPGIVHGYGSRSRSVSPIQIPPITQTLARQKPYQKTRFSSIQDLSATASGGNHHQVAERSASGSHRSQSTLPKANRVGSAIGRSFRKLMGKIRSSSAERKLKARNAKQRSPSPLSSSLNASRQPTGGHYHARDATTTYQQYNVIDGHISHNGSPVPVLDTHHHTLNRKVVSAAERDHQWYDGASYDRYGTRSAGGVASDASGGGLTTPRQTYYLGENPYGGHYYGKENRYHPPSSTDVPDVAEELPVRQGGGRAGSTGREARVIQQQQNLPNRQIALGRFSKSTNRLPTSNGGQYGQEPVQYSGVRTGPPSASNGPSYGVTTTVHSSSQTLPRNDHHRQQQRNAKPLHSSTINVSIVNHVNPPPKGMLTSGVPLVNTGPVKPARTYKALNRSKSFNVHGLNGTNDPSPIYLEKLQHQQQQQRGGAIAPSTSFHRSSSHLDQPRDAAPALKSPSIVNYISRSTRDLTHSPLYEGAAPVATDRMPHPQSSTGWNRSDYLPDTAGAPLDKKGVFLRNLQNRAPELYRTLHEGDPGLVVGGGGGGGNTAIRDTRSSPSRDYLNTYITRAQEQAISGATRPGIPSKDTASIVPRPAGSGHPDDYYTVTDGVVLPQSRHRPIDTDLKYQRISDAGAVVIELRNNS